MCRTVRAGSSVVVLDLDGDAARQVAEEIGGEALEEGFFMGPAVLDRVTGEMRVGREEIFGPVLCVVRVNTLDEAIEFTNGSPFGNACSIYTENGAAVRHFREKVEAGMLGVNISVPAPVAFFPFTGYKDSFFGDLHATGRDGVEFYTERKVVIERWQ